MNIISRLQPGQREAFAELAVWYKKNWLKGIGLVFLCQASLEYFANHLFGCSLTAGLLFVYAAFRANRKCKEVEQAPLLAGTNYDFIYFTGLVVATLMTGLFLFLALKTMPLALQMRLHLQMGN